MSGISVFFQMSANQNDKSGNDNRKRKWSEENRGGESRFSAPNANMSCHLMWCTFRGRDTHHLRDHFLNSHLPDCFYNNSSAALIQALAFLSQKVSGLQSAAAAGDLVGREMSPVLGKLEWTIPSKQAAREVYRRFFPGGDIPRDDFLQPGRWTTLNWECLAYLLQLLSYNDYKEFKYKFVGPRGPAKKAKSNSTGGTVPPKKTDSSTSKESSEQPPEVSKSNISETAGTGEKAATTSPETAETPEGTATAEVNGGEAAVPVQQAGQVMDEEEELDYEDDVRVNFTDAHFHLDRLAKKLSMGQCFTLSDVLNQAESKLHRDLSKEFCLTHGVAVFCDTDVHRKLLGDTKLLDALRKEPRLPLVFGLHPKGVKKSMDGNNLNQNVLKDLGQLLEMEETVAFGEIGLDNTVPLDDQSMEEEGLCQLLQHFKPLLTSRKLPIVIHYRQGDGERQVLPLIINLLENTLGNEHPIQVHHFLGKIEDVDLWMGKFKNVVFSVPVRVRYAKHFVGTLHHIPRERLLLETDSPYGDSKLFCTPWDIALKCRSVARIYRIESATLLKQCSENLLRFFRIKPRFDLLQDSGMKG